MVTESTSARTAVSLLAQDPTVFPELVRQAKAGDKEAFGTIMVYVGPTLRCQARRRLEQRLQAKFTESDLAQETRLRALAGIEDFHGITEREFIGWLLVILENVAKEFKRYYRAAKRDAEREVQLLAMGQELAWFPDVFGQRNPKAMCIGEEDIRENLDAIMEQLPDISRRVLRMLYWQNCGLLQIANRLGLTQEEVRAICDQAIGLVRRRLEATILKELQ